MKKNTYSLASLTEDAIKKLPEALAAMGLGSKYQIVADDLTGMKYLEGVSSPKAEEACMQADRLANREKYGVDARTVRVRQVIYTDILVPTDMIEAEKGSSGARQEAVAAERLIENVGTEDGLIVIQKGVSERSYAAAGRKVFDSPSLFRHEEFPMPEDLLCDERG